MRNNWRGIFVLVLLFGCAFIGGRVYQKYVIRHQVAIRIGMLPSDVDYDLKCAIDFISYHLEKQGYYVLGESYGGHLYPKSLDEAKINIFVRAFKPFFDLRLASDKKNVFYVQRYTHQYVEEFVGFDKYLTSQMNIKRHMEKEFDVNFLASGGVPHPLLKPDYQYDVLYIYEFYNDALGTFLRQHIKNVRVYGGAAFAQLSDKEREEVLSRAKLVLYDMAQDGHDDADYVPYAVYDIIGYGRPLMTNFNSVLHQKFGDNIYLYHSFMDWTSKIDEALRETDKTREQKSQNSRKILRATDETLPDFF